MSLLAGSKQKYFIFSWRRQLINLAESLTMKLLVLFVCFAFTFGQDQPTVSPLDSIIAVPTGGGVWTFPQGCSPSDCRTIQWGHKVLGRDIFTEFRISGFGIGYVALAISADTYMGDDDAYICARSNPESSEINVISAHLTGYEPPTIDGNVTSLTADWSNGMITCSFYRPAAVTKVVSGNPMIWDVLESNFNLLYAEGPVTADGNIIQHSFKSHTNSAFSLILNSGYQQLPTPPPAKPSLLVPVNPADDIDAYSSNGGVWSVPNSDCKSGCKLIHWLPARGSGENDLISITILGSGSGWIGMAISRDMLMGDDDCYVCSRENPTSENVIVRSAFLTGRAPPTILGQIDPKYFQTSRANDDLMICTFYRPVNLTKTINGRPVTWDLSQETFNLFFAEGSMGPQGELLQHSLRRHTNGKFYLLDNSGYKHTTPSIPGGGNESFPHIKGIMFRTPRGGGEWLLPQNCNTNCRSVQWEPAEDNMVQFTLIVPATEYTGFTITDNVATGMGDCYFCVKDDANSTSLTVIRGDCTSRGPPVVREILRGNSVLRNDVTDGIMTCSFQRPMRSNITIDNELKIYDLSMNHYDMFYGEGEVSDDGMLKPQDFVGLSPQRLVNVNLTQYELWKKEVSALLNSTTLVPLSSKSEATATTTTTPEATTSSTTTTTTSTTPTTTNKESVDKQTTASDVSVTPLSNVFETTSSGGCSHRTISSIVLYIQVITLLFGSFIL